VAEPRDTDDSDVPKLPRGRGIKLGTAELFRIAITIAFLVAVIMLTKPCSNAVSTFVVGFGSGSGSGSAAGSGSGSAKIDPYERLTPDMTEAQVKAAIERSKAKNAAIAGSTAGSGSGSGAGAGSGSGSGSAAFAPVLQRRPIRPRTPTSPPPP
jgi:hypothetical protein